MIGEKVKKYIEDMSSVKFLGYKDFIILDVNEKSGKLVYIKTSGNPLHFFNCNIPNHKIIYQREIEIKDGNYFELNRELRIISDKNKLSNVVLILVLNNYKSFNITLNKDGREEEDDVNIVELIKLQLPQNLISNDFFIQYEETSEDENIENYLVSVTRMQELQRLSEIINNEIFQLKLAIPSIFLLTNQLVITEPITSLIEISQEKIVHSKITADKKVFTDEYYNANNEETEIQENLKRILVDLPETSDENEDSIKSNIVFCSDQQYSNNIKQVINEFDVNHKINLNYSISSDAKIKLAYLKCLSDRVLNYNIDELILSKQKFDIERNITNRFVIGAFGLIILLLLILNASNMFIDNSKSEISEQNESMKTIELQVDKLGKKNIQLKADLRSLNNLKNGNQRISQILRIISESYIEQMALTDLRLFKTESNNLDIKLNGESASKNEVINFIKNLESNKSLHSIELVGMDKNKEILNEESDAIYDYKFTISMKFNDNKKS